MRKILRLWGSVSLIKRIALGAAVGAACGFLLPSATALSYLGTLFVSALKSVAPFLVFFLVSSSLAKAQPGNAMKGVLVLYVVSTLAAALVAALASFAFPLTLTLVGTTATAPAPSSIEEVLKTVAANVVANPLDALISGNYLGILACAIVLGVALRKAGDTTKEVLSHISEALGRVVHWIIGCAPLGILGLVWSAVSANGWDIFASYGALLLLLVGCMACIALVTNPLIVFASLRKNPYPLVLRCLKESGALAFFTRSSAANIPVNLELCRKLGLDEDSYSVSIPLGATINMAGGAVTITVMSLAAAHTLGIAVDLPTALVLCVLATVSACGASGVAGGSLLLIPLACSLFGIPGDIALQIVAIGFVIGILQDSCETALNSSSDVLFTAVAEYRLWHRRGREFAVGKDAAGKDAAAPSAAE